jgi:RHS repeat-associated protein
VLLGQRTPSNRYYPIADGIGSVVAVTDKDGNLVGRHKYEPFGTEQGTPAYDSDFRFAGELYDSDRKLYKIGARWYDPKLGRWTQPDLIEQPKDPVQANRYQYAIQDPVNRVDPTGLWSVTLDLSGFMGSGVEVSIGVDSEGFPVHGGAGLGYGLGLGGSITTDRSGGGLGTGIEANGCAVIRCGGGSVGFRSDEPSGIGSDSYSGWGLGIGGGVTYGFEF